MNMQIEAARNVALTIFGIAAAIWAVRNRSKDMNPDKRIGTASDQSSRDAKFMAAQDALSDEPAITLEDIGAIESRDGDAPF